MPTLDGQVIGDPPEITDEQRQRLLANHWSEGDCDVCGHTTLVGVASSTLGPISQAWCPRCLREGYEPYWLIVATMANISGPEVTWDAPAEWFKEVADHTLEFVGKTRDDVLREAQEMVDEELARSHEEGSQ